MVRRAHVVWRKAGGLMFVWYEAGCVAICGGMHAICWSYGERQVVWLEAGGVVGGKW